MYSRAEQVTSRVERTALVTGCSSGLGRAIALRLKARNWRVFATARNGHDLDALGSLGVEPVRLDLRESDSIQCAANHVLGQSDGRLAALVNNAGFTQLGAVEDLTRAEIREQFETNVFGTMELTQTLLAAFRRQGHGKIAFMSSVCGRFSMPFLGSYCASKFALEAFADALRRETRGCGIVVQVIEPGLFRTKGVEHMRRCFTEQVGSRPSVHSDSYARTLETFERSLAAIPEERSTLVAGVVEDFLEGRCRRARRVVPVASLVYEVAHRFFPDGLSDFLVDWRGRKTRRPRSKRR